MNRLYLYGAIAISLFTGCKRNEGDLRTLVAEEDGKAFFHLPRGIRMVTGSYSSANFDVKSLVTSFRGWIFLKVDSAESGGKTVTIDLMGVALEAKNAEVGLQHLGWKITAQTGYPQYAVVSLEKGSLHVKSANLDTMLTAGIYNVSDSTIETGRYDMFMIHGEGLNIRDTITLSKLCSWIENLYSVDVDYKWRDRNRQLFDVDIDIRKSLPDLLRSFSASGKLNFIYDAEKRMVRVEQKQ